MPLPSFFQRPARNGDFSSPTGGTVEEPVGDDVPREAAKEIFQRLAMPR